ncbi:MAG: Cleavage polyadenylation factor subunit clp1 [Heterodermia speciosa]|uniref:Polynucleotide 5'-hydroxyl-kinase GRC3 n=1 Tax=Heterodermia speciosa TaxID=116794 RepID=A0A8H3FPH7_9LECA|nr:MAG: Cleavage polyadenylation factor subunit clp1 [Heterodermia speciosa]
MALPGLGLAVPLEPESQPSTIYEIEERMEWRFEIAFGLELEVKLLSGNAEVFGTELAPKQTYIFTGTSAAIYTWHGCRIEVKGDFQSQYIADETPMTMYTNLHFALERIREQATVNMGQGPRILILGPSDAGKTSLAKILTAYASRAGRQPITVNLDPREGMLTIPGTISTAAFSSVIDVEQGWGSSPTNGPTQVPVKLPLVYYYGLANPEENPDVYKPLATRAALSVMNRLQEDEEARVTGCIIDTPGSISYGKRNYELIHHIISEFSVSVLVTLGSERLASEMARKFHGQKAGTSETITVLKLDKSGGCVDRDIEHMHQTQRAQLREYFHGERTNSLSPHTQQVDFDQLTIFKIVDSSALLSSLLPGGEEEDAASAIYEQVMPSPEMQNSVLAIVDAERNDSPQSVRDANVIGFIHISEVDEKKKKVKLLSPASGRLPNKAMIWGTCPEPVDI